MSEDVGTSPYFDECEEWPDNWVPVTMALRVPTLRMEERPSIWRVFANTLNKHSRTAGNGWYFTLGLGEVLTTPHRKNWPCYETWTRASGLDWYFCTTKQWKRDVRFGTWNVRSLYRSGSLKGLQEVGWDSGAWTGLIWLRTGTGGGHLYIRQWTFVFRKLWGIWLAESRLASQEGLCSM